MGQAFVAASLMITIDLLCDRSNNNNNKNGIMMSIMKIYHDQIDDTTGVALTLSLPLSFSLTHTLSYLIIKHFRYPVLQLSGGTYELGIGPILHMLLLLVLLLLLLLLLMMLNLFHLDCLLLYSPPSSSYGSCAVPSWSLC